MSFLLVCRCAAALEALDPAPARDRPLRARVGRMAPRADVDQDLGPGRASRELAAAGRAAHGCQGQFRMNLLQGDQLLVRSTVGAAQAAARIQVFQRVPSASYSLE